MDALGKVVKIMRYPVKSMKGHAVDSVLVTYSGLTGDRIYALVDEENKANFPWMTARQVSKLVLYEPLFVDEPKPEYSADAVYLNKKSIELKLKTPEGHVFDVEDPLFVESLEKNFGKKLHLKYSEKGMKDSRPVSLLGIQSVQQLQKELGEAVDPLRFRMNFYIDWDSKEPFFEDTLIGKQIQIGEKLTLLIDKKDKRCKIINLDPETGEPTLNILDSVAKSHENCFGVYCVVIREGIVQVGDEIVLLN